MRTRLFVVISAAAGVMAAAAAPASMQEWPVYAADAAATHYSPLTDIDRANIASVDVAWEWKTGDDQVDGAAGRQAGVVRGHAADDRRRAVRHHAVQPRRRARRRDRRGAVGLRSAGLRGRAAAERHRLRPPRRRRLARRTAAAHLPQQPRAPVLPRRSDRAAGRRHSATTASSISPRGCAGRSIRSATRTRRRRSSTRTS